MLSTLQYPSLIESEIKESRKKTLAQEKILFLSTSLCSTCAYLNKCHSAYGYLFGDKIIKLKSRHTLVCQ